MIRHEANYIRKAHRITIPIYFLYKEHLYSVQDWSSIGIGVKDNPDAPLEITEGETIEGNIILPTGKSSISLYTTLELKNIKDDLYGFAISEMEEKNRRVLRHYATLAIEGNGDRLEELMGDLLSPSIPSPIKESIALTPAEDTKLHKEFKRKLIWYFVSAAFFLAVLFYMASYNYTLHYNSFGVVAGNLQVVKAPVPGVVSDIYVKRGEPVYRNVRILDIDDAQARIGLKESRRMLSSLKRTAAESESSLSGLRKQQAADTKRNKRRLSEVTRQLQRQKAQVKNAQELFNQRIITSDQLESVKKRYNQLTTESFELQQPYDRTAAAILALQRFLNDIKLSIDAQQKQVTLLKTTLSKGVIAAPANGIVYSILAHRGEPVKTGDDLFYLQTDAKPYVLTKLPSDEVKNVALGQSCIIYSATTGEHYNGKVDAIGFAATESRTRSTLEVSENDVPLRIAFDNNVSGLPLYSRLDVWILRPDNSFRNMLKSWLW
jgi:multidrug resistance efflux pump